MLHTSSQILFVALFIVLQVQARASSPPRIVKQPPTDEILYQVAPPAGPNKPFVIECEAEGEPAPKYRWTKDGKRFHWLTSGGRMFQRSDNGTLEIKWPGDEDSGQYQCFAQNDYGIAISTSVFVRKIDLNIFKSEPPKMVTVNEGDLLKLQCHTSNGWVKPHIHWLMQTTNETTRGIDNPRITVDPEGNLWFSNVTRDDASDDFYYVCAVSSQSQNVYRLGNRVVLDVVQMDLVPRQIPHAPIRQYVTRENAVALRGKKLELFCIYGGTPLPQIFWTKDGQPVQWDDRISQRNHGKSLIIKEATFEDRGWYKCDLSNGVGEAQSYSIELNVMAVPYFIVEPEIRNAVAGETIVFRCEAGGVPQPAIEWIHNGKPISESLANSRRTVSTNSIVISRVSAEDTGNYGCNASNSLGYVYKDVYLNVGALEVEIIELPRQ